MGLFSKNKLTESNVNALPSTRPSIVIDPAIKRAEIIDSITEKNFHVPPLRSGGVMDFSMDATLSASGYGQSISNQHLNWFGNHGFIGYQTCAILSQHWLVDLACTVPVEDAIRKGWLITKNDGEVLDLKTLTKIKSFDKKMGLNDKLKNFGIFGRKYGVRVAVFDIESDQKDFYEHPFNIDGVKKGSYKGVIMNDPYYCIPLVDGDGTNPTSSNFYEPTYWQIGGKRYHKSHCIIFRHSEVPQILKPSYLYGGVSLTQQIFESVYNAEITATEIPQLIQNMRLYVMHMDLQQALLNPDQMNERLGQLADVRNNYGIQALGEEESLEHIQTTLTGLDELCAGRYKIVASVAQMPVCKIMKTDMTGGLVKGGGEESIYHETLESLQEKIAPFLDRHYQLLCKSLFGEDHGLDVVWNKLDAMTSKEAADVQLVKAQTAQAYVMVGALDGADVRGCLIADEDSGYSGLDADDVPEDQEEYPRTQNGDKAIFDKDEHWITVNGSHVQVDGEGNVIMGAGGKLKPTVKKAESKPTQKKAEPKPTVKKAEPLVIHKFEFSRNSKAESVKKVFGDKSTDQIHEIGNRLMNKLGDKYEMSATGVNYSKSESAVDYEMSNDDGYAKFSFSKDGDEPLKMELSTLVSYNPQSGMAKKVIGNMLEVAHKNGIGKIDTHANMDVGGYTWARTGFVPYKNSWDELRKHLLGQISEGKLTGINETSIDLLKGENPKNIWAISDSPDGKALLLKTSWYGHIDMDDDDAVHRGIAYANR